MAVAGDQWQRVNTPEDCEAANETDRWLVKPTDGYARLNRRIPFRSVGSSSSSDHSKHGRISLPSALPLHSSPTYGYWSTLLGAFLCLFASIMDGCDGEVARLKLPESDFGCWLETMCDYPFYLLLLSA